MMRRVAWLLLLPSLTGCGDEAARLPGVQVPRVAAIWEGRLPPGPRAVFLLTADGTAFLDGRVLAGGVQSEAGDASLRERLIALTAGDVHRGQDGTSRIPAVITADARTPWGRIVTIMNRCAHPQVQAYRILFRVRRAGDGAPGFLPWLLPRFGHSGGRGPTLRLRLFRRHHETPEAYTLIKLGREQEFALPPVGPGAAERRADVLARLRKAIAQVLAGFGEARSEASAEIQTPPPKGPHVPFGDVATTLGLLLEQNVYPEIEAADVEADLGYRADGSPVPDAERSEAAPWIVPSIAASLDPRDNDLFRRVEQRAKEAPTESALQWLAAHQSPDGGWLAADFGAWCETKPHEGERPDGAGRAAFDIGVSGLAVGAFLSAGYTNRGSHPYRRHVSHGIRFLKSRQDPEGRIGKPTHPSWIYNHAAASFALVEAYGMTRSPIFKGSAQRAIGFLERCRNRSAVWRYGLRPGDNDTSATGWCFLPLASARMVNEAREREARTPPFTLDDAPLAAVTAWLDRVTDERGHVGYTRRSSGASRTSEQLERWPREKSASLEALALYLRLLIGAAPDDHRLAPLLARVLARPPTWAADGSIDMTAWRFGALALFQLDAPEARTWEVALREALRSAQRTDGTACTYKGSWDPVGPWGAQGGRVYATAMMVHCLEARRAYRRGFGR